jgi:hypothetical protein
MILLAHLLLGAFIGQKISSPIFAIILAYLSHYILDTLPHIEYSVDNIVNKKWKKSFFDFLKVFLDIFSGLLLIFLLSSNKPIIYICAFFAILPDGLSMLNIVLKNKYLEAHSIFHQTKLHYLKFKKIPLFWRIFSQVLIVALYIALT